MRIRMIVAMNEARVIGRGGGLPWRLATDMARFKRLTLGDGDDTSAVIMGRKTWGSLPDSFRPLPERVNVVMSRDTDWRPSDGEDAEVALYPGRALEIAFAYGCEECWIIGGASIYELFLERVDEIIMTIVHDDASLKPDDALFCELGDEWDREVVAELPAGEDDEFPSTHVVLRRS